MKRTTVALGLMGLLLAVTVPGASAQTTLYEDDFSTDKLLKSSGTYIQGVGDAIRGDATILPFYVRDGALYNSPPDSSTGSDGVSTPDSDPPGVRYMILFGDKAWADVSIESNIRIDNQGTGVVALMLRAAPKTKPADPDSWYEFRYTTGAPPPGPGEELSGVATPQVVPNLRIMKVVNGKWSILKETDADKSTNPIPTIMNGGDHQEQGAIFRFQAKGDLLQAFITLPGGEAKKFLEVNDGELKAGVVGLNNYDYSPVYDNLRVQTVP